MPFFNTRTTEIVVSDFYPEGIKFKYINVNTTGSQFLDEVFEIFNNPTATKYSYRYDNIEFILKESILKVKIEINCSIKTIRFYISEFNILHIENIIKGVTLNSVVLAGYLNYGIKIKYVYPTIEVKIGKSKFSTIIYRFFTASELNDKFNEIGIRAEKIKAIIDNKKYSLWSLPKLREKFSSDHFDISIGGLAGVRENIDSIITLKEKYMMDLLIYCMTGDISDQFKPKFSKNPYSNPLI
jgi:hypothetical protein